MKEPKDIDEDGIAAFAFMYLYSRGSLTYHFANLRHYKPINDNVSFKKKVDDKKDDTRGP
jgi:hypothetical protein